MGNKTLALIYDFDKTLAVKDMQNFKFIPDLGMTPGEFWGITQNFANEHSCERTLAYLFVMIDEARKKGITITYEYLKSLGEYCEYYDGVLTWFDRINEYGKQKGIDVEHYIISSGNREIIKGTAIANKFKQIFACNFVYDHNTHIAVWPKMIINYTSKTQCLFRISKGILDITKDDEVNKKVKEKHVEFQNMIYIGDGITDIPCMTLIKERNGLSIAVHAKDKEDVAKDLVNEERVDQSVLADYTEGSKLDLLVKNKIDNMALTA